MFQKMINYFQPWALGISRQTLEGKVSGRMAKDERNYNWALITLQTKIKLATYMMWLLLFFVCDLSPIHEGLYLGEGLMTFGVVMDEKLDHFALGLVWETGLGVLNSSEWQSSCKHARSVSEPLWALVMQICKCVCIIIWKIDECWYTCMYIYINIFFSFAQGHQGNLL